MKSVIFKDGSHTPVGNIYCIGRSYAEHISELGNTPTGEPVIFMKPTTALTQDTTLTLPSFSDDIHHEVELVVYIGRDISDDETPSLDAVTGYGVGLDLTARDVQANLKAKGLPWTLAKGFRDGAWLSPLTHGTPPICQVYLSVNDETRQDDSTDKMLFDVLYQLNYLHKHFGLRQGDLIYTGTPKGVGKLSSGDKLIAKLNDDAYAIIIN